MEATAQRVTTSFDGVGGGSTVQDKMAEAVAKMLDKIPKYTEQTNEYMELQDKIIGMIIGLDRHIYSEILYKRYVERKGFEQISNEISYVYNYTVTLHGRALKEFERKYAKELNNS